MAEAGGARGTDYRSGLASVTRQGVGSDGLDGHRHGPGPFVTEDAALASHLADRFNAASRWQGPFRVGWPDVVALRYGVALNDGIDVPYAPSRPFLYRDRRLTALPLPGTAAYLDAWANAINDAGQAVGAAMLSGEQHDTPVQNVIPTILRASRL